MLSCERRGGYCRALWIRTVRSRFSLFYKKGVRGHADLISLLFRSFTLFSAPATAPALPTVHAPQYVNAGMALDKPLMEWVRFTAFFLPRNSHLLTSCSVQLEAYTFKAEARIDQSPEFAKRVYEGLVSRMLESGSTAASVFGTISVEAK